jgi:DNA-binding NtrC family response regulator
VNCSVLGRRRLSPSTEIVGQFQLRRRRHQLHGHGVRVVVATAYMELAQAARKKVAAILEKPFTQAELPAALRQAVDRRSESPEDRCSGQGLQAPTCSGLSKGPPVV